MKPFESLLVYPRPDKEYQKKSSLDFQRVENNLFRQRHQGKSVKAYFWLLCFIIGVAIGMVAFVLDITVQQLVNARWKLAESVVRA